MTSMITRDLGELHPLVAHRVKCILADCKKVNLKVGVFETRRTIERQKYLKKSGRSKTLKSYHLSGLAADIVFIDSKGNWTWEADKDQWDLLASIMESNGLNSLWKRSGWDGPHCELRIDGLTTTRIFKELQKRAWDTKLLWEEVINPQLPEFRKPKIHLLEGPEEGPKEKVEKKGVWSFLPKMFRRQL